MHRLIAFSVLGIVLLAGCMTRHAGVEISSPGSREVVSPDIQATRTYQEAAAARLEGDLLLDRGQPQEAIKAYTRATAAHPHFRFLYFAIAQCYERLGMKNEALAFYQQYLDAERYGDLRAVATQRVGTLRAELTPAPAPK